MTAVFSFEAENAIPYKGTDKVDWLVGLNELEEATTTLKDLAQKFGIKQSEIIVDREGMSCFITMPLKLAMMAGLHVDESRPIEPINGIGQHDFLLSTSYDRATHIRGILQSKFPGLDIALEQTGDRTALAMSDPTAWAYTIGKLCNRPDEIPKKVVSEPVTEGKLIPLERNL